MSEVPESVKSRDESISMRGSGARVDLEEVPDFDQTSGLVRALIVSACAVVVFSASIVLAGGLAGTMPLVSFEWIILPPVALSALVALVAIWRQPYKNTARVAWLMVVIISLDLVGNIGHALVLAGDERKAIYYSFWLPVFYIWCGLVFAARRGLIINAAIFLCIAVFYVLYFTSTYAGGPLVWQDSPLFDSMLAQPATIALLYSLSTFRARYARAEAEIQAYKSLSQELEDSAGKAALASKLASEEKAAALTAKTQLADIIDAMEDGVALFDENDRLLLINRRCGEFFPDMADLFVRGAAQSDLVAALVERLREDHLPEGPENWLTIAAEFHKDGGGPFELSTKEGKTFQLYDRRLSNGHSLYTVTDITALKENERIIRRMQRMEVIGKLTGGVAHDFNNILLIVYGSLDLLTDRVREDPESRDLVKSAMEASERASLLTHRLLAYARQQPLRAQIVDLKDLVSETAGLLEQTLGDGVEVRLDLVPDLPPVSVDRGQLENAIINLALNSRDAMPEGGVLRISIRMATSEDEVTLEDDEKFTPEDFVVLSVGDTGAGIPPEIHGLVFEPFFTTKEVGKGSGLGLSMVYGFTKQSGGHVRLASGSGQGTTIELLFPIEPAREPDTANLRSAASGT